MKIGNNLHLLKENKINKYESFLALWAVRSSLSVVWLCCRRSRIGHLYCCRVYIWLLLVLFVFSRSKMRRNVMFLCCEILQPPVRLGRRERRQNPNNRHGKITLVSGSKCWFPLCFAEPPSPETKPPDSWNSEMWQRLMLGKSNLSTYTLRMHFLFGDR